MKKYNEMTYLGRRLWWRVIGHRGGRTYEVSEPAQIGKGRKVIKRNISFLAVDEFSLLQNLASNLD